MSSQRGTRIHLEKMGKIYFRMTKMSLRVGMFGILRKLAGYDEVRLLNSRIKRRQIDEDYEIYYFFFFFINRFALM